MTRNGDFLKEKEAFSQLALWGASGHGKVIADIAVALACFGTITFIDDSCDSDRDVCGFPVRNAERFLRERTGHDPVQFLISIGDNKARAACFRRALEAGLIPATLIHPSAVISNSARIGRGTVVMPRVVVNADARVGDNCILNTGAVIEHDCQAGDHAHLSPGVLLAGNVKVGAFCHVGIGAVVLPGVEIGVGAVVGAGAVVLESVDSDTTVVGVPARPLVFGTARPLSQ